MAEIWRGGGVVLDAVKSLFSMPLKLRPSGLGSGIDKDRPDYTVSTGEWEIGRIYQTRGGPDNLRWFWSLTVNGPMTDRIGWRPCTRPRRSFRRVGVPGRGVRSWKRSIRQSTAERGMTPEYLAKPLTPFPLPTTDGWMLRTIG